MTLNKMRSLKNLLKIPRIRRKESFESPKENKICPKFNTFDAISMEILIGIVQIRRITKEMKGVKLT